MDTGFVQLSDLSITDLSHVLSQLHSARALSVVACTSKFVRAASQLAFRDLCITTGRYLPKQTACQLLGTSSSCTGRSASREYEVSETPLVDWRSVFFQQSFALSFNGINDYASMPCGLMGRLCKVMGCHIMPDPKTQWHGFTIDVMALAHTPPPLQPSLASQEMRKTVTPPAGGVLFSCQDREFGRSRRAARLNSIAVLYIGTDGYLYSDLGSMRSSQLVADNHWHRITLTMQYTDRAPWFCNAFLYVDGALSSRAQNFGFAGLPSYAVLGSGVTEGRRASASMPVYNCHSFHGFMDELRLWERYQPANEVQDLAFKRISLQQAGKHDHGLIGSWSLTEGTGSIMHDHMQLAQAPGGQKNQTQFSTDIHLGAVGIPSAHHTYSSVSNLVDCIPEQARNSAGPVWTISTAPVKGELVMEFCDCSV